jgi:hypothetical protein
MENSVSELRADRIVALERKVEGLVIAPPLLIDRLLVMLYRKQLVSAEDILEAFEPSMSMQELGVSRRVSDQMLFCLLTGLDGAFNDEAGEA